MTRSVRGAGRSGKRPRAPGIEMAGTKPGHDDWVAAVRYQTAYGYCHPACCEATPEPVAMSTSLVSRSINPPITTVMTATPIGYHSPL
jgi:hypothetical protein